MLRFIIFNPLFAILFFAICYFLQFFVSIVESLLTEKSSLASLVCNNFFRLFIMTICCFFLFCNILFRIFCNFCSKFNAEIQKSTYLFVFVSKWWLLKLLRYKATENLTVGQVWLEPVWNTQKFLPHTFRKKLSRFVNKW